MSLQHFYPYFDVVEVDWISELDKALRSAAVVRDSCEFGRTLTTMLVALRDGHGGVRDNCDRPRYIPSIELGLVEGAVTVTYVSDKGSVLQPGAVVLQIDERDALALLREEMNLIPSATPQYAYHRALPRLLRGSAGTLVSLTIETTSRDTVSIELVRILPEGRLSSYKYDAIEEILDGLWYVDLTRIHDDQFQRVLPQLAEAPGVIFDLRGYPGRLTPQTFLPHLVTEVSTSAQWHIPIATEPQAEPSVARYEFFPGWNIRPREPFLQGHRVFLTNGRAISYAETLMGIVEAYDLGTIIGEATAGTNGNINHLTLPGGYRITWTGMKVLKHDGSRHHGVGIRPDLAVEPTRAGVAAGHDEVLERAIEHLLMSQAPVR